MRKVITFAILVIFCGGQALAWDPAGHKIIASIAFRRLTAAEQAKVVAILKNHPRFQQDFDEQMPRNIAAADQESQNEWLFQQAAIWPDLARGFHGALKDTYHRPSWHYINQPLYLTDADEMALHDHMSVNLTLTAPAAPDEQMNVVQTIRLARKTLADQHASDADKGLLLAWLFHTVGDLHQPMHSCALFSRHLFPPPDGDRGGNKVSSEQKGNLHSLWDRFPGNEAAFKKARDRAVALSADTDLRHHGNQAASQLDEEVWLKESHKFAREAAYSPDLMTHLRIFEMDDDYELTPMDFSDEYLRAGGRISDARITEAGCRLGAILKALTP